MLTGATMRKDCAVVAGLGLNGLGIVRALGRAGVAIVALDSDFGKPTAATRFGTKVRVKALSGPAFIESLMKLRPRFTGDPVLMLTEEASVATLSAAHHEIARAYRFAMPDDMIVQALSDKAHFQTLAEGYDLPVPRAVHVGTQSGIDRLGTLRFPCVVKPAIKNPSYTSRFAKAYKVASVEDVMRLWSAMRETVDKIVVQEWIEGDDSDVYFCLQYRSPRQERSASFVGRKIHQWPLMTGGTASCIPAPEAADELTALTDGFFGKMGVVGTCSMEFKRDKRDSRFYLVEPTIGRSDYQEEIAALNGVNIPLAAYLDQLNLPISIERIPTRPRGWRDRVGYANARAAGTPDPTLELSPNIRICDAYFRVDDPAPYLALQWQSLRRRLSSNAP